VSETTPILLHMPLRFAQGKFDAYFYMTFSCWRTFVCEVVIRCLFVGYQARAPDQVHTVVAKNFFFLRQPPVGQGLLIYEVSRSHTNDAPRSVGLLWTSDQLVAETSI
jgi:hypothetical protein